MPDFAPLLDGHKVRVDGWTVDMRRDFIRTLDDTGSVSHAARAVGVSDNTAYSKHHRAPQSVFSLA